MRIQVLLVFTILLCSCTTEQDNSAPAEDLAVAVEKSKYPDLLPAVNEQVPSPGEKAEYDIAHDLWYQGNPKQAINLFRSFIREHPNSSLADDAQKTIGIAYTNLDQFDKAIEEFKKVKQNYPQSNSAAISMYSMAHAYFFGLNDFSNAEDCYRQFMQEATEDDKKWRDVAINQLENWSRETARFEGYADARKQEPTSTGVQAAAHRAIEADCKCEIIEWLQRTFNITQLSTNEYEVLEVFESRRRGVDILPKDLAAYVKLRFNPATGTYTIIATDYYSPTVCANY